LFASADYIVAIASRPDPSLDKDTSTVASCKAVNNTAVIQAKLGIVSTSTVTIEKADIVEGKSLEFNQIHCLLLVKPSFIALLQDKERNETRMKYFTMFSFRFHHGHTCIRHHMCKSLSDD